MSETWQIDTRLVHAGEQRNSSGVRATAMPIFASATFTYSSAAELDTAFDTQGLVYGRYGNPTVDGFEQAVAALEGGAGAIAYGSGMAALHGALLAASTPRGATQPEPCTILASQDLYGSTYTLLARMFGSQGWTIHYCDMTDAAALHAALADEPAIVFFEPLSNPLLRVYDVAAIVAAAHDAGARVVLDNTLATPILLRPIEHGADLVVHSATKYLGGHGDVIGGVVAARSHLLRDSLRSYSKLIGTTLSPFDARLLARGMKTLALRVRQQSSNAQTLAAWLEAQPQIARVYYPGLASHAQHALAAQQFGGLFGGMVAFDIRDASRDVVFRFMDALRLVLPATSLGDVFTLVSYSAQSSHRDIAPDERRRQGIGDGLVRMSVGIENVADIEADLAQALAAGG